MKIFNGKVISKKMEKTATVSVERVVVHPLYRKRYRRTKKYLVHDGVGVEVGQEVKFTASKPYSRLKRWKIVSVIERSGKSKASEKGKLNKITALPTIPKSSIRVKKIEGRKVSKKK